MGKKLFWSRDRLIKHEFDCLWLGLWLGLRLGLGLRVYVKPFFRLINRKNPRHVIRADQSACVYMLYLLYTLSSLVLPPEFRCLVVTYDHGKAALSMQEIR